MKQKRKKMWAATVFFYLGIVLALVRTAEALSMFGPKSIFGMSDAMIPVLWGWAAALLVEGVMAYAFNILTSRYSRGEQNMGDDPIEVASWAAAAFAVIFSVTFNTIDVGITYNWFKFDESAPITLLIRVVVVALPVFMALVFGIMGVLNARESGDSLPAPTMQMRQPQFRPMEQPRRPDFAPSGQPNQQPNVHQNGNAPKPQPAPAGRPPMPDAPPDDTDLPGFMNRS